MRTLQLLAIAALACTAAVAHADGTTRVAVVDTSRLFDDGGIARWSAARAKLDAERAKFVLVESPDGKSPEGSPAGCRPPIAYDDIKKLCKELAEAARKRQEADVWSRHEQEVLDPIEADVMRALERYARAHSIDLVLNRHELPELFLVVAAGADITSAFIKDYNAAQRPRPGAR